MVLEVRIMAGAEKTPLPIRESEHVDRKSGAEVCTESCDNRWVRSKMMT